MSALAAAGELSLCGMTRVAQRLESEGLVRRVMHTHDGRGSNAVLTDAGFARLEKAWPTNLAALRRYFLDHMAGLDLAQLAKAMQNVAT